MTSLPGDFWTRATGEVESAQLLLSAGHYNAAASRAYYAAFYAVTALFAVEGRSYRKHTGVEAAVHAHLVHTGRWPVEAGQRYRSLHRARGIGDYGGIEQVSREQAEDALDAARYILTLVRQSCPGLI